MKIYKFKEKKRLSIFNIESKLKCKSKLRDYIDYKNMYYIYDDLLNSNKSNKKIKEIIFHYQKLKYSNENII